MAFTHLTLRLLLSATLLATIPPSSAQQEEVECIIPHKMGDGRRPYYDPGQKVPFEWKSTFPFFNLTIIQVNHETQAKTRQQIYVQEPNTTANYIWTAQNSIGLSQDDPFHLWITNSEDGECPTCNCRSANFTVWDAASTNTSTTPSAAPSDNSSPSTSPGPSGSDTHLKLSLGLGLGLGIPLLIVITSLATWLCVRRRRQQRQGNITEGAYDRSFNPTPSSTMPLSAATHNAQPSSLGYVSDPSEKSPAPEMDSHEVLEMQTDNARVEAPQDAVLAELEGNDGMVRVMYDVKRV